MNPPTPRIGKGLREANLTLHEAEKAANRTKLTVLGVQGNLCQTV